MAKQYTQAEARAFRATITQLQHENEELKKQLKSVTESKEMYQNSSNQNRKAISSVHKILDNIPFAPPKKTKEQCGEEYTVYERLSMWVATFTVKMFGRPEAFIDAYIPENASVRGE